MSERTPWGVCLQPVTVSPCCMPDSCAIGKVKERRIEHPLCVGENIPARKGTSAWGQ